MYWFSIEKRDRYQAFCGTYSCFKTNPQSIVVIQSTGRKTGRLPCPEKRFFLVGKIESGFSGSCSVSWNWVLHTAWRMGVVQIVSFPGEQHLHNVTHSHAGSSPGATGVYIREVFFGFHRREKGWLFCIDHFWVWTKVWEIPYCQLLSTIFWEDIGTLQASPHGQPSRGLFHGVTLPVLPETVSLWGISHHQAVIPWGIPVFSWLKPCWTYIWLVVWNMNLYFSKYWAESSQLTNSYFSEG